MLKRSVYFCALVSTCYIVEFFPHVCASWEQVTVSMDDTIVLHGGGDKKQIEERFADR